MASNTITIHGKLGKEPDLRYTGSQMAIATFTVADTYGKDDKKKTTWHNVTEFGSLAENFASTCGKGETVIVTGRLEQEEFTKKDGTKGKSIKIIADEIGVSLRWNTWIKDQTENVMAQVGQIFPGASATPVPAADDFF
jgi:single-strand DNA-binding protein